MKDTKELLDFEIYPNLDRAEAVMDLNPQDNGKYYLLTCPKCGKPETYLYKTGIYIKCNRLNECGYASRKSPLQNLSVWCRQSRVSRRNPVNLQRKTEKLRGRKPGERVKGEITKHPEQFKGVSS